MNKENIVSVDFHSRQWLSHGENPISGYGDYLARRNQLTAKRRHSQGLPVAADFYKTVPYAVGLYYLVKDEGNPLNINDYRDKVSELLLTLDQDQTNFFCKLVEREIDLDENVSWLDSVEPSITEAN